MARPIPVAHDVGMEHTTTPTTNPTTPPLERPADGRMLAGVAAGLARHLGLPVVAIRIGFAVAAFFGGLGVVLYIACWALLPEEGETDTAVTRWVDALRTPQRRTGAVVVGLLAAIVLAAVAPFALLAAGLVLAGVLLAGRPTSRTTEDTP